MPDYSVIRSLFSMLAMSLIAGITLTVLPVEVKTCFELDDHQLQQLAADERKAYLANCDVLIANRSSTLTSSASGRPESGRPNQTLLWTADSGDITFWDNWSGETASPVLSSSSNTNFYGLGFWMPAIYEEESEDFADWVKNHGVQMSFGVGGENSTAPRFRFDYRWHDDNKWDDVYFQVEIPFQ
ncbi:hypothetical protein [Photobacterium ganghwense]|uniref:hypothetical protein n=1 Tax=Photobacterium ganghwense TaxID=320778 RepID=UPI001A90A8D4|nr:hypothetical protein [Photobacterium ganghwense]QSV17291.1 hypothetical protein FH974_20395 [Photobacterium ganghwense]